MNEKDQNQEGLEYWFNTQTKLVEIGKQSAALDRIGPFASYEEASQALETIEKRNRVWQQDEEERD